MPPHGLDATELDALLQSIPVICWGAFEYVDPEDIMLFMLMVGCEGCGGAANVGLPIPGFVALSAGKDELSELMVLSGVIVRLCDFAALMLGFIGGDTGGEDHEKVAAGDALFDRDRFADGRDGRIVEDEADAEALPQGSPLSISPPPDVPEGPPRTKASKSPSPAVVVVSKLFDAGGPPKVMNSFLVVAVVPLAPSSCSFRVCSFSIRADIDLIRVI